MNPSTDPPVFSPGEARAASRRPGIRVRIGAPLASTTDGDLSALRDLLLRHGVLCLVDQSASPVELHGFAARWGEVIELTPGLTNSNQEPGVPSITRVGNLRPDGSVIPGVHFAEYWHHDGDFWAPGRNHLVNFLASVVVPPVGGRTGLLDMRLAWARLEPAERERLAGATITVRASSIADFRDASPEELPPDAVHPVVLDHPLDGEKALYLPDSSTGIEAADGTPLGAVSDFLEPLIERVGIREHAWSGGDLLVTDNLQMMHRSMGGYGDHPRLLYRCQARIGAGD